MRRKTKRERENEGVGWGGERTLLCVLIFIFGSETVL